MRQNDIIPVFPLSLVVFPGHLVPLHIFEERYKRMIADCGSGGGQRPFGISFENEGRMAEVGCAVRVARQGEAAADGAFDIVCRAGSRYRLVEVIDERPYLRGRVEFFEDEEAEADPALRALVATRFRDLADLAADEAGTQIVDGGQVREAAAPGVDDIGAWDVAQRMGLEAARKQVLLEMRTENSRLQHLAEYLEELLPILEERQLRKRRVKSNGHNH